MDKLFSVLFSKKGCIAITGVTALTFATALLVRLSVFGEQFLLFSSVVMWILWVMEIAYSIVTTYRKRIKKPLLISNASPIYLIIMVYMTLFSAIMTNIAFWYLDSNKVGSRNALPVMGGHDYLLWYRTSVIFFTLMAIGFVFTVIFSFIEFFAKKKNPEPKQLSGAEAAGILAYDEYMENRSHGYGAIKAAAAVKTYSDKGKMEAFSVMYNNAPNPYEDESEK